MGKVETITPGVIRMTFGEKAEGQASAQTMQAMLELLAQTKEVVLRRAVTLENDRDFESLDERWIASCRFYLGDGPPGIMKTAPAPYAPYY